MTKIKKVFRRWLIISFIGFPHTWLILSFIGFPHTSLFAQAIQERSLVVIAVERKPFFLRINGRLINQKPRTHIRMDGLMENFYFLEARQIGGVIIKKRFMFLLAVRLFIKLEVKAC